MSANDALPRYFQVDVEIFIRESGRPPLRWKAMPHGQHADIAMDLSAMLVKAVDWVAAELPEAMIKPFVLADLAEQSDDETIDVMLHCVEVRQRIMERLRSMGHIQTTESLNQLLKIASPGRTTLFESRGVRIVGNLTLAVPEGRAARHFAIDLDEVAEIQEDLQHYLCEAFEKTTEEVEEYLSLHEDDACRCTAITRANERCRRLSQLGRGSGLEAFKIGQSDRCEIHQEPEAD